MELLNVYAITSDGTKVEASANTVGAVPQGQIATKDKAGLFKIGENRYKHYVNAYNLAKDDMRTLYVWVSRNDGWYDTDRLVWISTDIKAEMVSSTDDTGTITNAVCVIEDYNGNKCIKVTYTWGSDVLTAYVEGFQGESDTKTWVQVDNKGQAYVETQSVDIATNWSTGTVMPNANNFSIDSSTGDLQLNLATDTTRGGIKVEKTEVAGAKELTLIQFGSGDGYACLMVFPKLDVEQVQSGLQINSTSYGDTSIDGQFETSDFSSIFLNGGQRKTVSKWWFDGEGADQTIVWEDWEDGTRYKLSSYNITSVQHVKAYRLYRFKAYDSSNSITYLLDIIAGLDQEACMSDQEISDYVCKVDINLPNTEPDKSDTYQYYLAYDGTYHPGIMQFTQGCQISSFDTAWLCRFSTDGGGIVKGSLADLIEDRAGSSGDYLIKDNTISTGGYRFYFQNVTNGIGMYSPVYLNTNFHDYTEYAQYACSFGGTATENRVILNDKEQPIVDVDNLNITSKVQTIIDNYHSPKIASTTQLGHVQAGTNTDGYKVDDLTYTEISDDSGNVAQYTGIVSDNGKEYEITVKNKTKHENIAKLGYRFSSNDQSTWTSVLSDLGIPVITFVEEDGYYYLRVTVTSSATSAVYTLGSNVSEDGTKRYVDVDDNGVMSYLIPKQEQQNIETASLEKEGVLKTNANGWIHNVLDSNTNEKIGEVVMSIKPHPYAQFQGSLRYSKDPYYGIPKVLAIKSTVDNLKIEFDESTSGWWVVRASYGDNKDATVDCYASKIERGALMLDDFSAGMINQKSLLYGVADKYGYVGILSDGGTNAVAAIQYSREPNYYKSTGSGVSYFWYKKTYTEKATIIRIADGYELADGQETTLTGVDYQYSEAIQLYTFEAKFKRLSDGEIITVKAASPQYRGYTQHNTLGVNSNGCVYVNPDTFIEPQATASQKGLVRVGKDMNINDAGILNPNTMSMSDDGIWSTEEKETYVTLYCVSWNRLAQTEFFVTNKKPSIYFYDHYFWSEEDVFDLDTNEWQAFSKILATSSKESCKASNGLGFDVKWEKDTIHMRECGDNAETKEGCTVYYPIITTYNETDDVYETYKPSYYQQTLITYKVKRKYLLGETGGNGVVVLDTTQLKNYSNNQWSVKGNLLKSRLSRGTNINMLAYFRSFGDDSHVISDLSNYESGTSTISYNGNILYLLEDDRVTPYVGDTLTDVGEYAAKPTPNRVIMANGLSGNHCFIVDVDNLDIYDKVKTIVDSSVEEATDTTLGVVQYGHNGYKYYAYVNDTSTEVVIVKKIAEVTTNLLHTSFDASTKEATWLKTKPTFTFHEIPNSGYTITGVSIVQSGTSAIKVFKFSIAYVDSKGNAGTTILQATGNETCTYGMVNKSSETGQMMTDMTFLPDFIVAEMKKHTESWTFTLEDDSTITHNVVVLDD